MVTSTNPLAKHFRQPVLYIKLPTEGQYWEEGSLELPANGEMPVYPMTAKDEIMIRTPDALLNGDSVVQVIENCCPSIKDAWKIPGPDVDAILVAVRIASYGPDMGIDTKCPYCEHDNRHEIELPPILHSYKCPDYNKSKEIGDLKIKLKPLNYYQQNKRNTSRFEEDRIMMTINDESINDDTKMKMFNEQLERLVDINISTVAASTQFIELPNGDRVIDPDHILEYFQNCDNSVFKKLLGHIETITKDTEVPKVNLACESCEKEYSTGLEFDYANFFDVSS